MSGIKRKLLFVTPGQTMPPVTQDELDEIDQLEREQAEEEKAEAEYLEEQKRPMKGKNILAP